MEQMSIIMNGLETISKIAMEIAVTKEYALTLKEEPACKFAITAKAVNFIDSDNLYNPAKEIHKQIDQLSKKIEMLLVQEIRSTKLQCFNCHLEKHFARDCPEPRTLPPRPVVKKFCNFHRVSSHSNKECKRNTCKNSSKPCVTP